MKKYNGVLSIDVAVEPNARLGLTTKGMVLSPPTNTDKLDQLIEAKMINDITRANGNLRALKAFRIANEKIHQDRSLAEARRREIREPLENALVEIELLHGKLIRREEMIKILRKQLFVDTGLVSRSTAVTAQANEDSRLIKQQLHQEEELKLLEAQDKVEQYKIAITVQQKEIAKVRRVVAFQQSQLKDAFQAIEQLEFRHAEHGRKFENEKQIYMNMIETRENRIEKMMEDKEELSDQLGDMKADLTDKTQELNRIKLKFNELSSRSEIVTRERQSLLEEKARTDRALALAKDQTVVLADKHADLVDRYDRLIIELDKMVEEGQYIPDPNTNAASSSGDKDKRRTKTNVRLSDAHKAGKVAKTTKRKPAKIFEESTISTASGDDDDVSMDGLPVPSPQLTGTTTVPVFFASDSSTKVSQGNQSFSQDPNDHINNNIVNNNSLKNSNNNNNHNESKPVGTETTQTTGNRQTLVQPQHPPGMTGRFSIRKSEEEASAIERIAASSALRLKDSFLQQITELEKQLKFERDQRALESKQANNSQDSMFVNNKNMSSEIQKLNSKVSCE
jgi:hypothetical protein